MSDLRITRDHCRREADVADERGDRAARDLWTQIADEIDAYLRGELIEDERLPEPEDLAFEGL